MNKIFLIDDFPESCSKIKEALSKDYEIIIFDNVDSILDHLDFEACDGILVDINMPEITGDLLIKELRPRVNRVIPFCLMTSAELGESMGQYYDFNVDEFFHKDAHPTEISQRFQVVLQKMRSRSHLLEYGSIMVDLPSATVKVNNEVLNLTTTEFRIICQMIIGLAHEKYLNKKEFFKKVWGDTFVEERTITTHLANLNKKLSPFKIKVKTKRLSGLYFDIQ